LLKNDEIGSNLRTFSKKNFKSHAELSRLLGMKNPQQLFEYFRGKIIPGGELLSKLSNLGCDINWLLNGTPSPSTVKEPEPTYSGNVKTEIIDIKERLNKLELQNQKWMNFAAEVLEQYKKDCSEKNETIARLSVQFVTLVAANQFVEKVDCVKDKIIKE